MEKQKQEKKQFEISEETRELIDRDTVLFYYEIGEKRLQYCIQTDRQITERSYILLGLYFTFASALLGYIFSNFNYKFNSPLLCDCIIMLISILIALYHLYKIIKPHDYFPPGRDLRNAQIDAFVQAFKKKDTKDLKKDIICMELLNLQNNIDRQIEINEERARLFNTSILSIFWGLVLSFLLVLICPLSCRLIQTIIYKGC